MFDQSRKSGDYFDFNFGVDPYSMRHTSPMQKMQLIDSAIQKAAMLGPFMQQNGQTIDTIPYFEEMAKAYDTPILNEIIKYVGQQQGSPVGSEDMPDLKPASTTRNYTRTNRPGATRGQKDQALMSMLSGNKIQPSENTTARSVG